jgi:signal transduction histidine kinase
VGADPTDFEVQADEVDPSTDLSPLGLDPELFDTTTVYFPLLSFRGGWTILGTIDRSPRIFGPDDSVALIAVTDDAVIGPLSVRQSLLASIPIGSLALAAMFAFVAGSGLRPVRRMTAEAAGIEIGDLDRRLPNPQTGDELEQLASTLNGMLDRVSDGVATERRFVADAAHELRSPIAASSALLEVSLNTDGFEWRDVASSVLDEQRRLGALVDDLVLLARLDDAALLTTEHVMFDDVVAAETSRPFASDIEVVQLEPVAVDADPRALVRVVRNLLANADRHARSRIEVRLETTPTGGLLHIDDDGPGIPVEQRDRVFERFARLDDARSRDAGGSGIGLAIVKQVTEVHGGTVVATDSPLGGARFSVTLPVSHLTTPLAT